MGQKLSNTEELLKQSQKELLWLQRQLSLISTGSPTCVLAASKVSAVNNFFNSNSHFTLK